MKRGRGGKRKVKASEPSVATSDVNVSPSVGIGKSAHRASSPSPTPTKLALFRSLTPAHMDRLQSLHAVLDLDSSFVYTHISNSTVKKVHEMLKSDAHLLTPEQLAELKTRIFMFNIDGQRAVTVLRPGALEFIEFASFYFKSVSVWSAGQHEYVNQVVGFLFPPHVPKPGVIFSWADCKEETGGVHPGDIMDASPSNLVNVPFTKPLVELIRHMPHAVGCSPENVLLIDDRRDVAARNKDNLVKIPPFEPPLTLVGMYAANDRALEKLTMWFMSPEVIDADDIRRVSKDKIFTGA